MKLLLNTFCPFVLLSIFRFVQSFFPKLLVEVSWFFCAKQGFFFKKKMRSGRFLGQKGPKRAQNGVRQVLWKIDAWNFSDFLHEITANKVLILSGFFFREKISFWVFWVKLDQKRPKISSFKLYKKIIHDFWGNSVLKVPKMKFYKFYVKSLYQTFLIFRIK